MEKEFILLTIFIIAAVFITLLSLYGIRISKNDEPDYPHNHSYRYICSVIGLFFSLLFAIFLIVTIASGGYDPQNQIETKHQAVTSVEKKDDIMTIHNNDFLILFIYNI